MKWILRIIMFFVVIIRKDKYHYLSVPEEILSWVKIDRIMKLGHALPSLVVALILSLKLLPLLSVPFAELLKKNDISILFTVVGFLLILLIINGILIEIILEKNNPVYKNYKKDIVNSDTNKTDISY